MQEDNFPTLPTKAQEGASEALDQAFHAQLAKTTMGLSPISLALAGADWALHVATSPGTQILMAQNAVALSQQVLAKACQQSAAVDENGEPVPESDPRFLDPGWNAWPFCTIRDGFKASETWWRGATQVEGVSNHHQHMVSFFARQALDAVSPSNIPFTNPEVLRKGQESMGQTWLKGAGNFAVDALANQKARHSKDTDPSKPLDYEVGKDVAVTPGKVVFRNHLIELIQYTPITRKVFPEPLLIVPSCIMKYYILDLSPHNSMVRYLVGQGYTVFIISWRNPDVSDRELGMHDYLETGVVEAMATVKARTGAPRIHALGYCLGGTFLAIVASALGRYDSASRAKAKGANPRRRRSDVPLYDRIPSLATVTLLAALTDFSEPGEQGVFIDEEQVKALQGDMARKGFMSGKQMAASFQFLNSRDLIWSRNTRRYLLGMEETGNDLMSWNADVTRLPARMHSEYLSSLFLNNALATGQYRFAGESVTLKDIKAPMLVVGTVRDHVCPWRSVYKVNLLTDTHSTFILAAGGHNAGIVSEPGHARRSYRIDTQPKGSGWRDPEDWIANAPSHDGSWWEAMNAWLRERSGKPVPAASIKPADVLCDAPGEYVTVRYAD